MKMTNKNQNKYFIAFTWGFTTAFLLSGMDVTSLKAIFFIKVFPTFLKDS